MMRIDSAAALRRLYKNVSTTLAMTAGVDPSGALIASPGSKYTIYLQKLVVMVTTDAAPTLTFRDSAGTPVPVSGTPANPGTGEFVLCDLTEGIPLTQGKALDIVASAAGLAGLVTVEAYARLTGVATASDI
jgi:hypothetical protein